MSYDFILKFSMEDSLKLLLLYNINKLIFKRRGSNYTYIKIAKSYNN